MPEELIRTLVDSEPYIKSREGYGLWQVGANGKQWYIVLKSGEIPEYIGRHMDANQALDIMIDHMIDHMIG